MTLLAPVAFLVGLMGIGGSSSAKPANGITAFVDVSVLPMDREQVLLHQTIIVRNGVIVRIGPAVNAHVPRGAKIISGQGRWLTPGLVDMHTHVDNPADFPLLLASGVTTTLNMGGASEAYVGPIRRDIRAGRIAGPEPLLAFKIDGPGDVGGTSVVPASAAEARSAVRRAKLEQYDYLKIEPSGFRS